MKMDSNNEYTHRAEHKQNVIHDFVYDGKNRPVAMVQMHTDKYELRFFKKTDKVFTNIFDYPFL